MGFTICNVRKMKKRITDLNEIKKGKPAKLLTF